MSYDLILDGRAHDNELEIVLLQRLQGNRRPDSGLQRLLDVGCT